MACCLQKVSLFHGGDHFTILFAASASAGAAAADPQPDEPFVLHHWNGPLTAAAAHGDGHHRRACGRGGGSGGGREGGQLQAARARRDREHRAGRGGRQEGAPGHVRDVAVRGGARGARPGRLHLRRGAAAHGGGPSVRRTPAAEACVSAAAEHLLGGRSATTFELGEPPTGAWRCATCYRTSRPCASG